MGRSWFLHFFFDSLEFIEFLLDILNLLYLKLWFLFDILIVNVKWMNNLILFITDWIDMFEFVLDLFFLFLNISDCLYVLIYLGLLLLVYSSQFSNLLVHLTWITIFFAWLFLFILWFNRFQLFFICFIFIFHFL